MKNLLLTTVALVAIILLGACNNDDNVIQTTPTTQSQLAIGFENYVERDITRGNVESSSTIPNKGFGVFAMFTKGGKYDPASTDEKDVKAFNGAFMDNVQVKKVGDEWTYSPVRYWPSSDDEYVSFICYAPYNESVTLVASPDNSTGDKTFISYKLENNQPSATKDLMYNSQDVLNQQLSQTEDGKVNVNFKHATARIAFSITSSALNHENNFAKPSDTESDASITINNLSFGKKSENGDIEGAFISEGYFNLIQQSGKEGEWIIPTTASTPVSFSYSPTTTIKALRGTASSDITVNSINNTDNEYIFIIPQDFTTEGNDNLYCYIKYTVTYKSVKEKEGENNGKHVTYETYTQIKQNFEAGKAYIIKIDIGKDNNGATDFKPITLSSEIENWTE